MRQHCRKVQQHFAAKNADKIGAVHGQAFDWKKDIFMSK